MSLAIPYKGIVEPESKENVIWDKPNNKNEYEKHIWLNEWKNLEEKLNIDLTKFSDLDEIPDNAVVVTTFAELEAANKNTEINHVRLGADIIVTKALTITKEFTIWDDRSYIFNLAPSIKISIGTDGHLSLKGLVIGNRDPIFEKHEDGINSWVDINPDAQLRTGEMIRCANPVGNNSFLTLGPGTIFQNIHVGDNENNSILLYFAGGTNGTDVTLTMDRVIFKGIIGYNNYGLLGRLGNNAQIKMKDVLITNCVSLKYNSTSILSLDGMNNSAGVLNPNPIMNVEIDNLIVVDNSFNSKALISNGSSGTYIKNSIITDNYGGYLTGKSYRLGTFGSHYVGTKGFLCTYRSSTLILENCEIYNNRSYLNSSQLECQKRPSNSSFLYTGVGCEYTSAELGLINCKIFKNNTYFSDGTIRDIGVERNMGKHQNSRIWQRGSGQIGGYCGQEFPTPLLIPFKN